MYEEEVVDILCRHSHNISTPQSSSGPRRWIPDPAVKCKDRGEADSQTVQSRLDEGEPFKLESNAPETYGPSQLLQFHKKRHRIGLSIFTAPARRRM